MSETKSVSTTPLYDEDARRNITSFSDALSLLASTGVDVVTTDDLGDGFRVLEDKDRLVKTPFVILGMQFHDGDFGEFVSLTIVTEDGGKWIVNDGSTGIKDQCRKYYDSGRATGILCPRGLVRSDYENEHGPGTTFYLS